MICHDVLFVIFAVPDPHSSWLVAGLPDGKWDVVVWNILALHCWIDQPMTVNLLGVFLIEGIDSFGRLWRGSSREQLFSGDSTGLTHLLLQLIVICRVQNSIFMAVCQRVGLQNSGEQCIFAQCTHSTQQNNCYSMQTACYLFNLPIS